MYTDLPHDWPTPPLIISVEAVGIRASWTGLGYKPSQSYATLMSKRPSR